MFHTPAHKQPASFFKPAVAAAIHNIGNAVTGCAAQRTAAWLHLDWTRRQTVFNASDLNRCTAAELQPLDAPEWVAAGSFEPVHDAHLHLPAIVRRHAWN
jgi:hypothetical protein